ncbi:ABC-ATPase domain-containing protein [Thermoactinomyces sp. CICC 10523]|uniref:ABC-ATPase domain-containing protein n=1 Tax=Thermoactinomyces sp. CICC 10523 TaxID=2767428 RepID=UPI0018DD04A3|nr:ABC-ATPase domain-containing protein [Thermoactinomyces sp. CICC 10523]MBH8597724.1 ABC-ATPase domain-containing protein [Thermoactinomyces sp. CICC 10523]
MERLSQILTRIDGKGYKAYKDIQGEYRFGKFTLFIDHVQGDPFASPSRIRIRVSQRITKHRPEWLKNALRQTALEDWWVRKWAERIGRFSRRTTGTGKSGLIAIDRPGQQILKRAAAVVTADHLEVRLSVGLPARGRTVLGKQARQMLLEDLPQLVDETCILREADFRSIEARMQLVDNQQAIREEMDRNGWVSFVADGSILPRKSGINDQPLRGESVIPFRTPPSFKVSIAVPHGAPITGMAIPRGVTLIVGGGYHGKSTLLKAIERGVYHHIEGDGREYVLTVPDAVKIRSEDGRRVEKVNISPFISRLPFGRATERFSTDDASGSTSQAANIMESLEMGCSCLLMDEDTSATNFMIRDARMQALVSKGKEPITPFIDKVRQLYEEKGVSTILVLGGSGDYFDVADHVIMMDHYTPCDVTEEAKDIARSYQLARKREGGESFGEVTPRFPLAEGFDAHKGRKEKADALGLDTIQLGTGRIDLSALEQLVDPSQTRAIAQILRVLGEKVDGSKSLRELIDEVFAELKQQGFDAISPYRRGHHPGDLALPRKLEVAGAVNRLRSLEVRGE